LAFARVIPVVRKIKSRASWLEPQRRDQSDIMFWTVCGCSAFLAPSAFDACILFVEAFHGTSFEKASAISI